MTWADSGTSWLTKSGIVRFQVRSGGEQKAVQQEVEKLQMQSGAAQGFAPPKTDSGDVDTKIGKDLPPTKVPLVLS